MSYGPDVQELGEGGNGKGEGKSMEWFNRIELGRHVGVLGLGSRG